MSEKKSSKICSTIVWPPISTPPSPGEHICKDHAEIVGVITALYKGEKVDSHNVRCCVQCGSPLDPTLTPNAECAANAIGHRILKKGLDLKAIPTDSGKLLGLETVLLRAEEVTRVS